MSGAPVDGASRASAVALVGFMAAGKSAVGRLAAKRLKVPFVDTDALIEKRAGPISEIFAARGEQGFRALERDVVVEVLVVALREPCVVALGGGAVLSGDVREALARLPHVAWLTAPAEVLWARTRAAAPSRRPLAHDEQAFRRLLDDRNDLYRRVCSAKVLNDGSRTLATVAGEIVALAADGALAPAHGHGEDRP
ncbi:MAG: shikimate kinase [Actinobacteria bacterium]|nr:shikimate kinase [Actinomycetota bacterium]